MRDFTGHTYEQLLQTFLTAGFAVLPFEQYCDQHPQGKVLTLRHDVDKRPALSLLTAQTEHRLGVRASYYFRIVPDSNQPDIIRQIAGLGHEIGYHYEDMALCQGNRQRALQSFQTNLNYFRQFYPVRTCCMHGTPTNRYDGRDLWRDEHGLPNRGGDYDYRTYGIIGEPYFDIDFRSAFYLTDTGGRWDGFRFSLRDRVPQQTLWNEKGWIYHSSEQICRAVEQGRPPFNDRCVMLTTHPQRWIDELPDWLIEKTTQSFKNQIKRLMIWAGGL